MAVKNEESCQCIHVWHQRFGHRNPESIKALANIKPELGINIDDCKMKQSCESCIEGKMTRIPFPKKSENKSKNILDLIHTDVCGPMQTPTPSGNKYLLTFIDDHSRYTVVYLLRNKSDVFKKLEEFVRMVQIKFQQKPKVFRSDRGGEYMGEHVKAFLRTEGIQWQTTAPYTPQQNGVAERKNRTLTEMARCMLIGAGLKNRFWGEAILTAAYLQNRLPTKAIEGIPYEVWHNTQMDISNLHIFGCTAFALIPKEKRQKLDARAEALVFVGYENGSKAFRLLNPDTDRITISRDVKFIEKFVHKPHGCESCPSHDEVKLPSDVRVPDTCTSECNDEMVEVCENDRENHPEEENFPPIPEIRRSTRLNKGVPPERYVQVMNAVEDSESCREPLDVEEALSGPHREQWLAAMKEEMSSLNKNNTWTLTELPEDRHAVGCKWIFKIKHDAQGSISRFKARLVAQGFTQKFGSDYDEVFAPVGKQTTLRALLGVAGQRNMRVRHFDIKTAFLNGELSETVFMKQPPGFVLPGQEGLVCKLNRSIYGLKQSARIWNEKINSVLIAEGFQRGTADPCLYSKKEKGEWIYALVYVDDLIVACSEEGLIDEFFKVISATFEVKDLGDLKTYLGIQVERDSNGIFHIHQEGYIKRILERFGLKDAKPSKTPLETGYMKTSEEGEEFQDKNLYRQAIGCLLYVATSTRPDISVSVSILSRKISSPTTTDWTAVKRIIRYLKGTMANKLSLGGNKTCELTGFADADWAGDLTDRKSNSGYLFQWGGGTISWASRKQTCVSLSSTEAEFVALAEACQEAIWLQKLFKDFHQKVSSTTIHEDNQSCLKLVTNEKSSQRTKHIDTRYFFIRDLCHSGVINFKYCSTMDMTADLLTKPLDSVRMRKLTLQAGVSV